MLGFIEDIGDAIGDAASDLYREAEEGITNIINAVEETVSEGLARAEELIEQGGEALADAADWLEDTGEDFVEWVEDRWDAAVEYGRDVVESVVDGINRIAGRVSDALDSLYEKLSDGLATLVDMVESGLQWVAAKFAEGIDWLFNDFLPMAWGVVKIGFLLSFLFPILLLLSPAILLCAWLAREYGKEYGSVIHNIIDGNPRYREIYNIQEIPARARYVMTSDLHRYPDGNLNSMTNNETQKLYNGVLEYYANQNYGLIENGDVEDYWIRGGSGYGVVEDINGLFPDYINDVLISGFKEDIARGHLRSIVFNNLESYTAINSLFHSRGSYYRTLGNHDDVYSNPGFEENLQEIYEGIEVADYIVLVGEISDGMPVPVGAIAHGHQTDAWNRPACSFLGKMVTSLFSGARDIGSALFSNTLEKDADDTAALINGEENDEMIMLEGYSKYIGVDVAEINHMDEVLLFDTFHDEWGEPNSTIAGTLDSGPYLFLGHTHKPLDRPGDPRKWGVAWDRYFNTGTTIFHRMITCVEWDGTRNPFSPDVNVVAWRYAGNDPEGPTIVRTELRRQSVNLNRGMPDSDEDMILVADAQNEVRFSPQLW